MENFKTYRGWKIQIGAGDGNRLPQGYYQNIYACLDDMTISLGDLLQLGNEEEIMHDKNMIRISGISCPHPYYGKPICHTRDELIAMANDAISGKDL